MSALKKDAVKETTIPVEEVVFSLYKSADKIYARSVSGLFDKWRWLMVWVTQLFFYGVPWLQWDGRQAMLFDLETKRFYVFGLIFHPQDLIYLSFLLIVSALALFLFTAVAGRLWCGFTCPQTVYTEIFMWMETKIEGDRLARMRLDEGGWTAKKLSRKTMKHIAWLLFALWTGITFVGYFSPIRDLLFNMQLLQLSGWETFWVAFYGFATYGNAGFMREQVCKYMCPYARFQSAMFDDDTLIVTYDEARGEPRGARSKKLAEKETGLGSCIDCSICVQVCPTGIDIRKGLQYECIGCGACIDACDDVMDKMGYEKGLIKYSTQNAMQNGWTRSQMLRRLVRPRVLVYSAILSLLMVGMVVSLYMKPDFRVDILRDRGMMGRFTNDGKIENVFNLKLENDTEVARDYALTVSGLDGLTFNYSDSNGMNGEFSGVKPFETRNVVIEMQLPDGVARPGSHKIYFEVTDLQSKQTLKEKSVFIIPVN
ncbi:cytochrome c oxidase accessory protein CcoG [Methylophilus aquaticus]|uniref:Cytochrome c oxidase accessory protein CcoG n=1 Tax=Methylophilus aquaticus TaxID=1971610 RepID=A0ABT9JVU7_9PROT|nr:cytochrome c oxidase accessory protein CcoG [Methylophilus aquaticus]MDP8568687.1 cytochrome c oxidase accessory protein CcoG [Methylophilus aquaticus]